MFASYYFAFLNSLSGDSTEEVNMSKVNCFTPKFWFAMVNFVSGFLMTLNASVGVLVYCAVCRNFRQELGRQLSVRFRKWSCIVSRDGQVSISRVSVFGRKVYGQKVF
jgi:hypothetical protein